MLILLLPILIIQNYFLQMTLNQIIFFVYRVLSNRYILTPFNDYLTTEIWYLIEPWRIILIRFKNTLIMSPIFEEIKYTVFLK